MADWSQLPNELLQLISKKLNSDLYLLRFRSVCSTWRSSSTPNFHHNQLSLKLPNFFNRNDASTGYLVKHSILLVKPPPTVQRQHQQALIPWLIRIGPNLNGKTHLWETLLLQGQTLLQGRLPFRFPRVLDFNKLSVVDLGSTFIIIESDSLQDLYSNIYHKRVVAAPCHGEQPKVIVTFTKRCEVPVMSHCEDSRWEKIPNMPMFFYGGICIFKGRPCVVDKTGRTMMINLDLSVDLLAEPMFCGGFKSLVESEGDLLLVDRYRSDSSGDAMVDVFRLDEKEKKWVKLTNLGDRVLFLGYGCSFSVSALDLGFGNGNCVIFTADDSTYCDLSVCHLDQGRVSPLSDYTDYFKLFWPPPEWIVELHS